MTVKRKKTYSNIHIGSLNCHGLLDKLDCPNVIDLISKHDIFCVCETWIREEDQVYIPGFEYFPLNRKKCKGPIKGGIGLFIRDNLRDFIKIRYDISSEIILWCKLDKAYFGYKEDIYIGNVYIPPVGSSREKDLNIDHFKKLYETTATLSSKNVILIGDFNARTHILKDTLNKEKYEDDVLGDFYSEIYSIRNNQDKHLNNYGKQLIEYCISTRSYIANGRTLGDIQGKLTCHQSNGSSTVDYAVITENLKNHVKSFEVLNPDTGSDHSPISLQLNCPHKFITQTNKGSSGITMLPPPFKWNEKTKNIFEKKIVSDVSAQMIEDL